MNKKIIVFSVLFLFLVTLFSMVSYGALTDDIVDYWSFDGGNFTGDLSKTGNNSGTSSVTGVVGTARLFTRASANYIAMNNNASYNNPAFSFCYFVKYGGAIANSNIPTIWKGQGTNVWYLWGYLDGATDTNTFYTYPSGTFDTIVQNGAYITIPEVWENWCYTYNSSMVSVYKNATLTLNKTVSTPITNDNTGLYFGKYTTTYFNGTMDEIVYWNRTITASEVQSYYNSIMNGTGYPFQGAIQSHIYANSYSGQQLKNFTVFLQNGTTITNYSTTNGSVYIPFYNNATQISNITINAFSPVSIINYTILNYNVSNSYVFNYTIITFQNRNSSGGNLYNLTLRLTSSNYAPTMVNNLSDYFAWLYFDNYSTINVTGNLTGYATNSTIFANFSNGNAILYNLTLYRGYSIASASYLDTYLTSLAFNLTTFNATVTNGTLVDNYSTTNGTIYTNNYNTGSLFNVTIFARNGTSNINFTIPNYDLSMPILFNYSIFRMRTFDFTTGGALANLSYTLVTGNMPSISNVTNGSYGFIMFNTNTSNNLSVTKNGYNTNYTLFPTNSSGGFYDFNMTLTPLNTIVFSFFNSSNSALLNGTSVTVSITYNNLSYSNSSSTGIASIYNITPNNYTIMILATGFNSYTSNITVGNNTFQTFGAYLSGTTSTSVTLTTKDNTTTGLVLGSVFVVENQQNITSPWVLVGTYSSDITGSVYINYNTGQAYRFTVSAPNYITRQFNISPITQPAYDVPMQPNGTISVTNPYESIISTLAPNTVNNHAANNFTWVISSPLGTLVYYNYTITVSYNATLNMSGNGNNAYGGTLTPSFLVNTSIAGSTLTFNYQYQLANGLVVNLTRTYLIGEIAGVGTSASNTGGNMPLFDKIIIVLAVMVFCGGLLFWFTQSDILIIVLWIIIMIYFTLTAFLSIWISGIAIIILFIMLLGMGVK